jgi:hypothetical protein
LKRENGKDTYKRIHWGIAPTQTVNWPDPDYPDELVAFDHLVELHFRPPQARKDVIVHVAKPYIPTTFVAFDAQHPGQRLYILTPEPVRRETRRRLWHPAAKTVQLRTLAKAAPGRHATPDYPVIAVQPLGWLTHVTYLTDKKDDGLSNYIHEFGEVNGKRPILAVDGQGRYWIAGGDYTCPTGGITN